MTLREIAIRAVFELNFFTAVRQRESAFNRVFEFAEAAVLRVILQNFPTLCGQGKIFRDRM